MDLSFPYTHNNHFKFGYYSSFHGDVAWYVNPPGYEDFKWVIQIDSCEQEPMSFKEECYRAARLIHDSTTEVPHIMFSGGAESEIVVRSFYDQGIPFDVTILQFRRGMNLHDIAYGSIFCETRGINYNVIELDIERFMEDKVYDYCSATACPTPMLAPTMWLADQMHGLPIIGSGEPYLAKKVPVNYVPGESPYEPSEWVFQEKERIQAWYRHFFNQQRPAIPGFFQYTPELMLAFLTNPVVNELVANKRVGKLSTVSTKSEFYRSEFPDMVPRPKYHGFEYIMELDEIARSNLATQFGHYDRIGEWEYTKLISDLRKVLDRD